MTLLMVVIMVSTNHEMGRLVIDGQGYQILLEDTISISLVEPNDVIIHILTRIMFPLMW